MASRLELQLELEQILGNRNVYYQPPESMKIGYPAIVYSRSDILDRFADDDKYLQKIAYRVIVIDKNPDSEIVDKISKMRFCKFQRHYVSDNLNHDVFTLYY